MTLIIHYDHDSPPLFLRDTHFKWVSEDGGYLELTSPCFYMRLKNFYSIEVK